MKVVVFSDSHGDVMNMVDVVGREQPDYIFHLGDAARDADDLQTFYPQIPLACVFGNCDGWRRVGLEAERLLELQGHRLLLLHGHTVHVKQGLDEAMLRCKVLGAEVLLFGHTHIPYCDLQPPLWLLNPGSIKDGRYGVLRLTSGKIICQCKTTMMGEDTL